MGQGSRGRVEVWEDFMSMLDDSGVTIVDADGLRYNDIRLNAISGDVTMDTIVTLGGGMATFTGAGGAADGINIATSPFIPADGQMWMECRFKYAAYADARVFVGFAETVDRDEAVNPFTLSGTTLTANNTGNTWGIYYDTGATTDDFRAAASSAGVIKSASGTLGVRANATLTADKFVVIRVTVDQSGGGEVWMADTGAGEMRLVDTIPAGTLSTTAVYHPMAHLAANSTGDELMTVDYFGAGGGRSWTP